MPKAKKPTAKSPPKPPEPLSLPPPGEAADASDDDLFAETKIQTADEILAEADDLNLIDEQRRQEMMRKIASYRFTLAKVHHRLENGEPMDLDRRGRWPFQYDLFQDDSPDVVIVGSVGWGKTVWLICDDLARAICGLRVMHVLDQSLKRDKFVLSTLSPILNSVPYYKGLVNAAADERQAEVSSARFKHFGDGSINFVSSTAESEFYTFRADSTAVDEHQLCNQENLHKLFSRRTGSFWRLRVNVGNPRSAGSDENTNIDWEYRTSDQREWNVPCPYCGKYQILGWWSHFIDERRNEFGAILSVEVRDPDPAHDGDGKLDIRPVCIECGRPMRRLNPDGKWIAKYPGRRKHGYRLTNLYNPEMLMNELLVEYRRCLSDPGRMTSFINDQLGLPFAPSGSSITMDMLESASTGLRCGVRPYRMIPANEIRWRELN